MTKAHLGSQLETLVADIKVKPYSGEVRVMIPILEMRTPRRSTSHSWEIQRLRCSLGMAEKDFTVAGGI